MKVKKESEIIQKAKSLVAEKFGVSKHQLKLAKKEKKGIFFTFNFSTDQREFPFDKNTSYWATMYVDGKPFDLYKN